MALVPVQSPNIFSYLFKFLTGGHNFIVTVDRSRLIIKNQYDANESLLNLFKFSGTAIQFIFFKPVTWFCISLHYFGFFYVKSLRTGCQNGASCWVDDFTEKYSIQFTDITGTRCRVFLIFADIVVFLPFMFWQSSLLWWFFCLFLTTTCAIESLKNNISPVKPSRDAFRL